MAFLGFKQVPPIPDDESTIYGDTTATPPESIADTLEGLDDLDPLSTNKSNNSSVPWPGSTYIIRSVTSGHVLTLLDGQVLLSSPGSRGSIHWQCVDTKGWLGFRNPVSAQFLGHNDGGFLICKAQRHQSWENFCVRAKPGGGYVLLMTHFERLWHVGAKSVRGVEKLAKVGDANGGDEGIVWEFVKV